MKPRARQPLVQGGVDLVEEATHVLRSAPVSALAAYYLGSLPFVLGVLYFWADMSRNPFARRHDIEAALGLALLFIWMKFWQVVFARQIHASLVMTPTPAWSLARIWRSTVTQAMIQPWGLFLLPLALIAMLPFPAVYAFFQNATVLDDGEKQPAGTLIKKSSRLAALWPLQSITALLVLAGFALFVFSNWMAVCYMLPHLGETLLGMESVFTRSGMSLMNTTFLATMLGLTYLSVDPIAKTVFTLRCLYGESRQSGEDLKARLKSFSVQAKAAAVAVVLMLGLASAHSLRAAEAAPAPTAPGAIPAAPASQPGLPAGDLDNSINQIINQSKYVWRLPRDQAEVNDDTNEGVIARFFDRMRTMISQWLSDARDWLGKMLKKLWPSMGGDSSIPSLFSAATPMQILIFVLIAVVASLAAIFLVRYWQDRRRKGQTVQSMPIQPIPDLLDENIGADQLPEDGWTKLGRELLERGEYRLALRAFYLSGLAHLATRNLISLARFKSNREYERELGRRGHAFPQLSPTFGELVTIFERAWYGLHEVNGELVVRFTTQVEKLKATE